MKKQIILTVLLMLSTLSFSKDIKTLVVTTTPQMHCTSCENKIKGNLRFEKGVKRIETSIEKQTVTIQYDASKTTEENLIQAFTKIGYTARTVNKDEKSKTAVSPQKNKTGK
ncbi:MAG: heavy-metal-associated domain-containing protein [Bacteroidales bacterium]|nr:heavy-metal-associated domain-containing protein [Bacteroidales bacterium]